MKVFSMALMVTVFLTRFSHIQQFSLPPMQLQVHKLTSLLVCCHYGVRFIDYRSSKPG